MINTKLFSIYSSINRHRKIMPIIKKEGKDTIIFATKEDHATPSKLSLPEPEPTNPGLILPNGEINWNCPCLGGMASGPCGIEFREAFSCFHHSTADPKGSDCYEAFKTMQSCMSHYPALYSNKEPDLDDLDDEGGEVKNEQENRRNLASDNAHDHEVKNENSHNVTSEKEVQRSKAQ